MPFVTSLQIFALHIPTQESYRHAYIYVHKNISMPASVVFSMVSLYFLFSWSFIYKYICRTLTSTQILKSECMCVRVRCMRMLAIFNVTYVHSICAFTALHIYIYIYLTLFFLLFLLSVAVRTAPLQLTVCAFRLSVGR